MDLFVVSVLLDAGAGKDWVYHEKDTEGNYSRSEGLAICSLHMFEDGLFSGEDGQKCRVDGTLVIAAPSILFHPPNYSLRIQQLAFQK